MENADNILTFLRIAFRNLEARKDSLSNFSTIDAIYTGLRRDLMADDKEAFDATYERTSAWHTAEFDILMDEAFEVANVSNYDEFMVATYE